MVRSARLRFPRGAMLTDIFLLIYSLLYLFMTMETFGLPTPPIASTTLFRFHGREGSFLRLSDWSIPSTSTWNLTFEFRTNSSRGLLLYADEIESRFFVLLRLTDHENQLECRVQLPSSPTTAATRHHEHHLTFTIKRPPNDNNWNIVVLKKKSNSLSLILFTTEGRISERRTVPTTLVVPRPVRVMMGGIAGNISTHYGVLTHPSVVFEPKFHGLIRRVSYMNTRSKSPEALGNTEVDLIGNVDTCDKKNISGETEFSGDKYLAFRLPLDPSLAYLPVVLAVQFRSRTPDGVIFYIKTSSGGIICIALRSGNLRFYAKLGSTSVKRVLEPSLKKAFQEYGLHNFTYLRTSEPNEADVGCTETRPRILQTHVARIIDRLENVEPVILSLDGVVRWKLPVSFDASSRSNIPVTVFVGGIPEEEMDRSAALRDGQTFRGSILQVSVETGRTKRNLFSSNSKLQSPGLSNHEDVRYECLPEEMSGFVAHNLPYYFCRFGQSLEVPVQGRVLQSVSLQMRTTESHGLVLFYRPDNVTLTALDMFDGQLVLVIRRPFSKKEPLVDPTRVGVSSVILSDGAWHNISLDLNETTGIGRVQLDDSATEFVIGSDSSRIVLKSAEEYPKTTVAYFGSVPSTDLSRYPELWSAQINSSFRGAIRKMTVNERRNLVGDRSESATCPAFIEGVHYCVSNPCQNAGVCREGWQRSICDCQKTKFLGDLCERESAEVFLAGDQSFIYTPSDPTQPSQLMDIMVQFRTTLPSAFLFRSLYSLGSRTSTPEDIVFSLNAGRLRVVIGISRLLPEKKEWIIGGVLNDDKWHAVKFTRRGRHLNVSVDDYEQSDEIGAFEGITFYGHRMEIGAVPTLSRKKKSAASVDSHLFLPGFIGYMRKFLLDNIEVLPLITPVGTPKRIVSENSAYTFKSSSGYVAVSSNQDDEKLDIQFVFRTAEANGLILFNGQPGKDFIALELLHGNLQYISDMGNGAQIISSSTLKPLNDNLWHNVHVAETSRSHHMFIVDGRKFLAEGPKKKFSLDLDGPLFIGGVRMKTLLVLPRMVRSQTGFMGCLAEIKIGGRVVDLVTEGQDIEGVARGCEEPKSECHSSLCKHGGKCVRQWSGFGCDCDMTSFSGSNCSKYSVAYRFGPFPGLIIYHFDTAQRPDSRADRIAFGLVTFEEEAIICRIASFTSDDIIEFQIVAGHLFVVYNMGSQAHLISDLQHRLSDGKYHTVQFERNGANASIRIDQNRRITKEPIGRQLDTFNGISTVEIGGKLSTNQEQIERSFHGFISGFVLNGIRILDLVADGDPNIVIEGYPELVSDFALEMKKQTKPEDSWKNFPENPEEMQRTEVTETQPTRVTDDLITVTRQNCREEDDSCSLTDSKTGDDLIFAQYTTVSTTPAPMKHQTTSPLLVTVASSAGSEICDDDEDCDIEASGDTSLLSARSAHSRSTRPPIIINVTFTTPSPFSTLSAFNLSLRVHPTKVRLSSDDAPNHSRFPAESPSLSSPKPPARSPMSILTEHAALIAGTAVGLIFLVALIVFLALRCRKSRREVPAAEPQKTYQTFTKPEPSPANTIHRNGDAQGASKPNQNGTLTLNKKHSDKEFYV